MTPTTFTDLGMALAMESFDVDLVPYGQAVTAADLAGADLVVVLPVLDLPSEDGDVALYDEAWSAAEVTALEQYVTRGGLLVLGDVAIFAGGADGPANLPFWQNIAEYVQAR